MINFNEFDIEENQDIIPDKEFADFLISHGAYYDYVKNIKLEIEDTEKFFKRTPRAHYISNAFNWTYVGRFKYWANISRLWIRWIGKSKKI